MLLFHVVIGDSTVGRSMTAPPLKPRLCGGQGPSGFSPDQHPVPYETLTNDKEIPDIFVSTFDFQVRIGVRVDSGG